MSMASKPYQVQLEVFEGPLDLLLHLIKKDDLDILNIEISRITKEYLEYLDLMKELNLEIVGEFLVMATTLLQIKARSLLPSAQTPDVEAGPDPRSELVQKLIEYQKFKEAANFLKLRSDEFQNVFYRGAPHFEEREKSLNIRIFDLLGTLREVLDRAEDEGRVVAGEEYPIEEKIEKILKLLAERPYLRLIEVFEGEKRRRAIITCFLALLELIKTQRIFARQERPFAEVRIYSKDSPAQPVWPSEHEVVSVPQTGPELADEAVGPEAAAAAAAWLAERAAKPVLEPDLFAASSDAAAGALEPAADVPEPMNVSAWESAGRVEETAEPVEKEEGNDGDG